MANNVMAIIMEYAKYSSRSILFFVGIAIFIISGILIIKYIKELTYVGKRVEFQNLSKDVT